MSSVRNRVSNSQYFDAFKKEASYARSLWTSRVSNSQYFEVHVSNLGKLSADDALKPQEKKQRQIKKNRPKEFFPGKHAQNGKLCLFLVEEYLTLVRNTFVFTYTCFGHAYRST